MERRNDSNLVGFGIGALVKGSATGAGAHFRKTPGL